MIRESFRLEYAVDIIWIAEFVSKQLIINNLRLLMILCFVERY